VIGRTAPATASAEQGDFSRFIKPPQINRRDVHSLNDAAGTRFMFASCR
jgi:hypothetical protein